MLRRPARHGDHRCWSPTTRRSPPSPTAPSTSPAAPPARRTPGTARPHRSGADAGPRPRVPRGGAGGGGHDGGLRGRGGRWREAVLGGRASSAGAGVALTAVSGWLIVRAAEMPPVLTLLVAIVAVRVFGLGRALLRWAERLTAHDAALRLAAATRVRLWTALARAGARRGPHARLRAGPGGRGRRPASRTSPSACGRRCWSPPRSPAGHRGRARAGRPRRGGRRGRWCSPPPWRCVLLVHRRVDAGAARPSRRAARHGAAGRRPPLLEGVPDLRAHGLADRRRRRPRRARRPRRPRSARTGARAAALAPDWSRSAPGWPPCSPRPSAAVAGLAGPALAVLALAPLALPEPLTGLVTGAAAAGCAGRRPGPAGRRPRARRCPPTPPSRGRCRPPVTELARRRPHRGVAGRPRRAARPDRARTAAGAGWLVVRGPSGAGKSTLLAVLMAVAAAPRRQLRAWTGAGTGPSPATTCGRGWRGCRRRRTSSPRRSGPTWPWPRPAASSPARTARRGCARR